MKIYKFRPLINGTDFCRLKRILEKGEFWCSNFWELNDPMEGVFSIDYFKEDGNKIINKIYDEKAGYKICSFSGDDKSGEGFHSPLMWGHYAGGFKGVAIEVEAEIKRVKYHCPSPHLEKEVEKILLAKNLVWEYEKEYRFLKKSKNNLEKIGKITAIYFGNPYGNIDNSGEIQKNKIFQKYLVFKEEIINIIKGLNESKKEEINCPDAQGNGGNINENKKINCFDVKIECGEVVKDRECKIKNKN